MFLNSDLQKTKSPDKCKRHKRLLERKEVEDPSNPASDRHVSGSPPPFPSLESAGRGERTERERKEERGVLISFREKRAGEGEAGRDPFSFCPSLFLRLAAAKREGGGGAGFGGGWGPKRPRNETGEEENCYVSSSEAGTRDTRKEGRQNSRNGGQVNGERGRDHSLLRGFPFFAIYRHSLPLGDVCCYETLFARNEWYEDMLFP